jgi:hypothetical protein
MANAAVPGSSRLKSFRIGIVISVIPGFQAYCKWLRFACNLPRPTAIIKARQSGGSLLAPVALLSLNVLLVIVRVPAPFAIAPPAPPPLLFPLKLLPVIVAVAVPKLVSPLKANAGEGG